VDVDEMQTKLSQKATREPKHQFENLYSLLCNEVWLRVAHQSVSANAGRETAGIDGMTMSNFNGNLDRHLGELKADLGTRTFEPLPVDRAYVPKPNGKLRSLGMPALEDKLVQLACAKRLTAIYEQDFLACSDGYRPGRGALDAVRDLTFDLQYRRYGYLGAADIQGVFDPAC